MSMKLPLILLTLALVSSSFSQPYYRGEIEFALDSSLSAAVPSPTGLTLAGHLEAGYNLALDSPVAFNLVLDPSVRASRAVTTEPGLNELYAAVTYGDLDLSAGVERLPLETARLSVPYSVETVGVRGVRHGVAGVRGVFYRGDWRVRGAALYRAVAGRDFIEHVTPLVSVRKTFSSFDLEAHALYQNGLVAGLGGSGLLGGVVVYGEAWLLTQPLEGRGVLGLNGNIASGTWTLEGAYVTPVITSLKDDLTPAQLSAAVKPRPAVLAQLALPLDEGDMSLSLTGNQECRRSIKRRAEGMISGSQARTFGQQGVSQGFSGVMVSQLPTHAGYSLPFLTHQLESSGDQLGMLQVGGVG